MRLKLPLVLLASLLGCYLAVPSLMAQTITYYNPDVDTASGGIFKPNSDGSGWITEGQPTPHKVYGYFNPNTAAPLDFSKITGASFTLNISPQRTNAFYVNIYLKKGDETKRVDLILAPQVPVGGKQTYSTGDNGSLVLTIGGILSEEYTLAEAQSILGAGWTVQYCSYNIGDTVGNNPNTVEVFDMSIAGNGFVHKWNFIADDTKLTVDKELTLGDTVFNKQLTIAGGSNETGGALIYMGWENGAGLNDITSPIRILGGNKAIGDQSTFTIANFTRADKTLTLSGVKLDKVDNTPTNRESALITFERITTAGARIVVDNLQATASGTNSKNGNKFGNQMGAVICVSTGLDSNTMSFDMSNSSFENCFASASDPRQGEATWTTYGTQGTVYLHTINQATLTNVTFKNNSVSSTGASAMGGAICTWATNITVIGSRFEGNKTQDLGSTLASKQGYAGGAALYLGTAAWGGAQHTTALIQDSSFVNNQSIGWAGGDADMGMAKGGALYAEQRLSQVGGANPTSTKLTVEDSIFTGNQSHSSSKYGDSAATFGGGGAIYIRGTELTLKVSKADLTYTGNLSTLDGVAKDEMGGFLMLKTQGDSTDKVIADPYQASAIFNIAAGRTLTIGDGTAGYDSIAGNAGSLIVKAGEGKMLVNSSMAFYAGALKVDQGTFALKSGLLGASSVAVASGASFIAGVTGVDLVTRLANTNISAEKGATLGTYLTNTGELVMLKHSDVINSIQGAYGNSDATYTYWTQGLFKIDYNTTTDTGGIGGIGEGSNVVVEGDSSNLSSGDFNLAGGSVDLSKVTGDQPISGSVVTGDSGTVVTTTEQTVLFDANQNVGYSLNGGDADTAGAKLVIGSTEQSNATAPEVVLRGDIHAKEMTLNVGTTSVSGTVKTTEGITVGNDNLSTTATLTNNGTIHGQVDVLEGNILKGAGTYMGDVTLTKSTFIVGNSPGQNIFAMGSTFDSSDSTFLFAVDGTTAATQGGSTSGTYSNIILRDGVAATGSGNTANIEVWRGLFDATSSQLNLTLINNEGTGSIDADFFKSDAIVTGQYADLLKNAKISFDADGNVILTGNLDTSYAQSVIAVDAQAYANSLWSSSQVLSDFGKLSRDQASAPRQKELNLWMSAMGDFSSVTGTQGYTYNGGGYGIGGDYAFNKSWIAGAGFGQTWGTNKTDSALLSNKQDGTMFSLYGQYAQALQSKTTFLMDGYFGYAQVENKATAATGFTAPAKWSDNVYAAGIRASWAMEADKDFMITPFVGLDFVTAKQGAITVGNRMYHDGKMHNLTMPLGVDFAKKYSLGGTQYLIPSCSVAYAADLSRKAPSLHSSVLGEDVKFTGVKPGRNAAFINLGTRWIITPAWSTAVNYTLEARSKMTNQAVNVSCNYSF